MTIRIDDTAPNSETANATLLLERLRDTAPHLDHPDVHASILSSVRFKGGEADLVLLYMDARPENERFVASGGARIDSFVLVIEVKHHSSDRIAFEGTRLLVRYGDKWKDASDQCERQKFALRKMMEEPGSGPEDRLPAFVNNAIWLAATHRIEAMPLSPQPPVHFMDMNWDALVSNLSSLRVEGGRVTRTLVPDAEDARYHSFDTMLGLLTRRVSPTKLDLARIRNLERTRFDAEKTQYIQRLGQGMLLLRGRAGTGKTFSLLQIALHLGRSGKSCALLTFNHGLIADITRNLSIMHGRNREAGAEIVLPRIDTRYAFIQSLFIDVFGEDAEADMAAQIPGISDREQYRTDRLLAREGALPRPADFVFIDEGQDWSEPQRDLMVAVFGADNIVVADGVDQFVSGSRCTWAKADTPVNRRHSLRVARRSKSATTQVLSRFASKLGVAEWDLVPDHDAQGGRISVLVEPDLPKAMATVLSVIDRESRSSAGVMPIDSLVCLPSVRDAGGVKYKPIFDRLIEEKGMDSWRGFDPEERRIYPDRDGQLRAVLYQSCRGMEGWVTACMNLDTFHRSQIELFDVDEEAERAKLQAQSPLLYEEDMLPEHIEGLKQANARQWVMIPLTRSIDHLIVHLTDAESHVGRIFADIDRERPGSIDWL